jgi:hypothetical protein
LPSDHWINTTKRAFSILGGSQIFSTGVVSRQIAIGREKEKGDSSQQLPNQSGVIELR